jgi:hypothetical protein
MERERRVLGEVVTEWIRRNRVEVVEAQVVQSSDRAFHCIEIVIFFK